MGGRVVELGRAELSTIGNEQFGGVSINEDPVRLLCHVSECLPLCSAEHYPHCATLYICIRFMADQLVQIIEELLLE